MPTSFSYEFDTPVYKGKTSFPTGLFINGEFVDGADGSTIDVINPTDGSIITRVSEATAKDVDVAVEAAQKTFDTVWGLNTPGKDRTDLMNKLAAAMVACADELAALDALDNGNALFTNEKRQIHGKVVETSDDKFTYVRQEPIGVVPSEFTPLSALKMCTLVKEAGFPPGVLNVLVGYGKTVGAAISSHKAIEKVAFTGSTLTGRSIMEAAARSNLKNVTLELGGKSPNIIFNDADLQQAVDWSFFGVFWNHGQACIAGSRIYVQSGIYDKFLENFTEKTRSIKLGDPFAPGTYQGPQVSNIQRDRILGYIKSGKEQGATLHYGGESHDGDGYFVNPTIFVDTKPEMKIVQEEIFGPVCCVIKFEDEDDVIRQANDTVYGLAAAVFTKNIDRALKAAHKLKAGSLWVNANCHVHASVPFGGYKQSGIGREFGEEALHNYLNVKAVHINLGIVSYLDLILPEFMESTLKESFDAEDWSELRRRSLLPGGFGEDRKWIWPKLLFVVGNSEDKMKEESADPEGHEEQHRDERQIQLDTDRSFVLYPDPVDVKKDRESLQEELRKLLVAVFRRRPRLHYFQGYHDIVTVFFLTLPPEIQLECIEKLSLHRVRDSMGPSLEPVLGLLRFMKGLLRLTDVEYAETLEENTPLPYFALSNLLTLFSHDMPTLPLIQHVFDYLLCRPPVMVVYLVTALTLSRKAEVKRLQEEGDDGMLHSLLASLPPLTDEGDDCSQSPQREASVAAVKKEPEGDDPLLLVPQDDESNPNSYIPLEVDKNEAPEETSHSTAATENEGENNATSEEQRDADTSEMNTTPPGSSLPSESLPKPSPHSRPSSPSPHVSAAGPTPPFLDESNQDEGNVHPGASSSSTLPIKPVKPTIPLTNLLQMAESLYERYPPNSSSLKHKLSDIMGPQSVVFTWAEAKHKLPSDDTAEKMVDCPHLIVYPAVEDDEDEDLEKTEDWETEASEDKQGGGKKRNKLRKRRSPQYARKRLGNALELGDRKTMVAGAVLVLGVAMAVYGVRSGALGVGEGRGHHSGLTREWRRLGGWVGSVLLGTRYW
ncbi:hypothetical protein V5O48_009144 [Marasmius crinis-equi]|uniref:Rab-GAP TBC domain-containing protein n=1 Tax=Marasmius crinis-equi TaxID=585013 RepID=A0ABR3FC02_9AGAR